MNAYEKIRAALEQAYKERHEPCSVELRIDEALAALAELERSAAEPVATVLGIVVEWTGEQPPEAGTKLYAAPPAPVAAATQFVAGEVTKEMCWNVFEDCDGCEKNMAETARHWLDRWRKELGPALGLVEIREPSDAECIAINEHVLRAHGIEGCGAVLNGRVIFDAVSKWLKGEL